MDQQAQLPQFFLVKKWTLIGFCIVNILGILCYAATSAKIAENIVDKIPDLKPEEIKYYRKAFEQIIITTAAICVVFQLVAQCGILVENICLVATMAIESLVSTVGFISISIAYVHFWPGTAWNGLTTIVAIIFLWDLYKIKRIRRNYQNINGE